MKHGAKYKSIPADESVLEATYTAPITSDPTAGESRNFALAVPTSLRETPH